MPKGKLLSSDVQVVSDGNRLRCVAPVLVTESTEEDEVREDGVIVAEVLYLEMKLKRNATVEVWLPPHMKGEEIFSVLRATKPTKDSWWERWKNREAAHWDDINPA